MPTRKIFAANLPIRATEISNRAELPRSSHEENLVKCFLIIIITGLVIGKMLAIWAILLFKILRYRGNKQKREHRDHND